MRIRLKNTVEYKGHTYKAGRDYTVTKTLEKILLDLDEKKVKRKIVEEKEDGNDRSSKRFGFAGLH